MADAVVFAANASTKALTLTSGVLRYLDTHSLSINLASGSYDDTKVHRLTIKKKGNFSGSAITYWTPTVSGSVATVADLDLSVAGIGTVLDEGNDSEKDFLFELSEIDGATIAQGNITLYNRARRPGDSEASAPSANTYTDAEIDALFALKQDKAAAEDTVYADDVGPVYTDRTTGTEYRMYINNGMPLAEEVT